MHRIIFSVCLAATLVCGLHNRVFAQQLNGRYGFGQFASDSSHAMVEFYFDIPSHGLSYRSQDATRKSAVVICNIKAEQMGIVQGNELWRFSSVLPIGDTSDRSLIGVHRMVMAPGDYKLHVTITDSAAPAHSDSFDLTYRIRSFATSKPVLSSIELGSKLRYVSPNDNSSFVKGGIEIVPNVRNVYSDGALTLVYYTEVYNLNTLAPSDSLFVETQIMNNEWTPVFHRVSLKAHPGPAIAVAESLGIEDLPSGRYVLGIRTFATHGLSKKADTSFARSDFVVNNSALPALTDPMDAQDAESSTFADKREGELDTLFLEFTPIATKQEKTVYKSLSGANPKRDFLFQFWDSRNHEAGKYSLKTYLAAVDFSNQNFKSMGKPGWHTDRGRVYLQYGPPSTAPEKHYMEVDSKPYEIWYYNEVQGGVQFVFVDVGGYGDFKLVHSDEQNEIHDDGWQARYAKNLMKGQ